MEGPSLGMPPPEEGTQLSPLAQQLLKRKMRDWQQGSGISAPTNGEYTSPGSR